MSILKEIAKKSGLMGAYYFISKLFGFVYFFIVANLLGPAQYGLLGLCMSIYEILSIPSSSLNNGLNKYIAEKKQISYFKGVLKINFLIGLTLAVLLFMFSSEIALFLKQPIAGLIKLVSIFLVMSIIRETISTAILGTSEIKYYVINELFFHILKLITIVLVIIEIKNAYGVLIASIISLIFSIFFALHIIKKIKFNSNKINIRKIYPYSFKFLLIFLITNTQPQIYILLLSKFWSTTDVGYFKFLALFTGINQIFTDFFPIDSQFRNYK